MTKIKYDGKLIKVSKVNAAELDEMGMSDKAIDTKYVDSDNFYWQDDDGNIYETTGYVNRAASRCWNLQEFKDWFNKA